MVMVRLRLGIVRIKVSILGKVGWRILMMVLGVVRMGVDAKGVIVS
jgi:hypothetical protein